MRPRPILALLLGAAIALAAQPTSVVAGEALKAVAGTWSGKAEELSTGFADPGELQAVITPDGGGLRIDLKLGTLPRYQARFAATGRPNVYESAAEGMFAMFSTKPAPNPLQGGSLVWAREDGAVLHVYRLDLPDGRMRLDQMVLEREGDKLVLRLQQQRSSAEPTRLMAKLTRQGAAP